MSWREYKIPILSLFILMNLLAVGIANVPRCALETGTRALAAWAPSWVLPRLEMAGYRIRQYGNLTGLDTHWEMFSKVKGENWSFLIEGECAEGRYRLPLSGQSKRSFWQRNLFDFKEAKVRVNIALSREGRQAYVKFLCRHFLCSNHQPLQKVQIRVLRQKVREPQEALRLGSHLEAQVTSEIVEDQSCG